MMTAKPATTTEVGNAFRDVVGGLSMVRADIRQQLERYVTNLVETGSYGSKSEVLREGERLVQDREAQPVALDAAIERGIADSDADRGKPAEEVFDRLEAKYQAMADGNA